MAQAIEHTPYEWSRWRGRVVLFKRVSLKPLWGLCVFAAGYLAVISVLVVVLLIVHGPPDRPLLPPTWLVLIAAVFIAFVYAFIKVYRSEEGVLVPVRVWRIGRGVKLACETLCIPQPTSMGGTLPGAPTRWLVVRKDESEPDRASRVVQVYHDLDLLMINLALTGF